jgi:hypothetical protein
MSYYMQESGSKQASVVVAFLFSGSRCVAVSRLFNLSALVIRGHGFVDALYQLLCSCYRQRPLAKRYGLDELVEDLRAGMQLWMAKGLRPNKGLYVYSVSF